MAFLDTYVRSPLVAENAFGSQPRDEAPLPGFGAARDMLPDPHWEGHDTTLYCYWKAWELAFANLRRPSAQNGFVSNYVSPAFNDYLFMWDSVFMLHFGRYGCRVFPFQHTLDNLYAKQHPDGFICREIRESDGSDAFGRFDPVSTGPNVMPWSEWEHYRTFNDGERLARVFPVLVAYHRWLRSYRTWQDGSYWSTGWASGMDNQPRVPEGYSVSLSPAHLTWVDACCQQTLSARLLAQMADVLGRSGEVADMRAEDLGLRDYVNRFLWDERTAFYYDRRRDGSLSPVKSIGAYWALLADIALPGRREPFIDHLRNPAEFARPDRVPSLAADDPHYRPDGGYWLGGVWAPTNYMVAAGLCRAGQRSLAHEIALTHLDHVVRVYEQTGTIWENYAPEAAAPGNPAKRDFVGWSGLPPIAVLLEHVFGLEPDAPGARLVWHVRLLDGHGVARYPFAAGGLLDLACARRRSPEEKPQITATANIPLELEIHWPGGSERLQLPGGGQAVESSTGRTSSDV
ncbi:MAG TPA: trehalase family glycosidase [Anaerolineae bacterium]|nr:trehalase family glycosidase [Anaerolineae bacterium]HOR01410.1 trehalase family glycosidase [Anaerolineae bacterium]HPL28441.1 trehalase family glycosidase [Anaerolineae bacterium]